ncbi:MAG: hypothetical protein PHU12_02075 [Candidatus Aenigmarchaeota archaeon]|nr:hypothetical protein [Candidatus Aenigmarchaeota archaeon]
MSKKVTEIHLYINSNSSKRTTPWHSQKCWSSGCNALTNHPIAEASNYNPDESLISLRKLLDEYTKEHDICLEIHDLDLKSEQRKNWFRRIKQTPMIVIGNRQIYDMPANEEELSKLLENY